MRDSEIVGLTYKPGDSKARGSYEDTSIGVSVLDDIHIEVDAIVHLGYMMTQEHAEV